MSIRNVDVNGRLTSGGYFLKYELSDNAIIYPWDKTRGSVETEHPRDSGVSRVGIARVQIDRVETD